MQTKKEMKLTQAAQPKGGSLASGNVTLFQKRELKDIKLKGSIHYAIREIHGKAHSVPVGYTEKFSGGQVALALEEAYMGLDRA